MAARGSCIVQQSASHLSQFAALGPQRKLSVQAELHVTTAVTQLLPRQATKFLRRSQALQHASCPLYTHDRKYSKVSRITVWQI